MPPRQSRPSHPFLGGSILCYIVAASLALFIISCPITYPIPPMIAAMVNTIFGKVVVVILALALFGAHPIIGALGLVAAYELIKRSEMQKKPAAGAYIHTEARKARTLSALNQFPVTVEETVIAKQIPYTFNHTAGPSASYKPVLDNLHDAAKLQ